MPDNLYYYKIYTILWIVVRRSYIKHIILFLLHILFHEVICLKQLTRYTIIGIFFVLITGTLAHFLYDWSENNHIVGFFVPVNESIWEHMKLLFFPMLLYSLFVIFKLKKAYPCIASSFCFGIITGTLLIPLLFYSYTKICGKDFFVLDIGIFILSVIIAFWISYKLTLSCKFESYTFLLCFVVCLIFISFVLLTYHPPKTGLFSDNSQLQVKTYNSFVL